MNKRRFLVALLASIGLSTPPWLGLARAASPTAVAKKKEKPRKGTTPPKGGVDQHGVMRDAPDPEIDKGMQKPVPENVDPGIRRPSPPKDAPEKR